GVILSLAFRTTDRTPAHIHTIAKNIIDLLGRPLPELRCRRKGLLYSDDSQIHGLVVRCEHGADAPSISVDLRSLSDFREDLALAAYAASRASHSGQYEQDNGSVSAFSLDRLARDRDRLVSALGEEVFGDFESM